MILDGPCMHTFYMGPFMTKMHQQKIDLQLKSNLIACIA